MKSLLTAFIPPQYAILAKVLGVAIILLGAFTYGYTKGTEKGQNEIAKYEQKVLKLELDLLKEQAKLPEIQEKIVTEFVDRVRVVKEKEYVFIDNAKNSVPSQFNVSNGWVYLHDISAANQGTNPDPTRVADATPSEVRDNQALAVIVSNYARCTQNAEQLIALQSWIQQMKNATDEPK